MLKLNPETIVKMPIVKNPFRVLTRDGCGCARGLSYVATHDYVDWGPLRVDEMGEDVSFDSPTAYFWVNSLEDSVLINEILRWEGRLLNDEPPESVKKDMIDWLVVNGYVEECLQKVSV